MMKRALSIFLAALILLSVPVFNGCGKSPQEQPGGVEIATEGSSGGMYRYDKNKKAKIKVFGTTQFLEKAVNALEGTMLLDRFKQIYPNIEVETIFTDDMVNIQNQVLANTAVGNPPDIIQGRDVWIRQFVETDSIIPLDDYVKKDPEAIKHIIQTAVDMNKYNGKIYALPVSVITYAMYYNKDIFDKAGMPYPKDSWTGEEFIQIARKLTRHDPDDIYVGLEIGSSPMQFIYGMFNMKPVQKVGGRFKVDVENDPGTVKAVETLVDLVQKDKLILSAEEWKAIGSSPGTWACNRIAMMLNGPFAYKSNMRVGVLLPPKGPNGERSTWAQSFSWSIHTAAQDKDACWELVKYLVSQEYQEMTSLWSKPDAAALPSHFPTSKAFAERTDLNPDLLAAIKVHMEVAKYYKPIDEMPDIMSPIRNQVREVYEGRKDMATALKDLQVGIDKQVNPQSTSK